MNILKWVGIASLSGLLASCSMLVDNRPYVTHITDIQIDTGKLQPSFSEDRLNYEIDSLNSINNIHIMVKGEPNHKYNIGDKSYLTNQWVEIKLPTLNKESPINLNIRDEKGNSKTYSIATLPNDFPDYKVKINNPLPGNILFSTMGFLSDPKLNNFLIMTNHIGEPVYFKKSAQSIINFMQKRDDAGNIRYVYHETISSYDTYEGGNFNIMDDKFKLIKVAKLLPNAGRSDCVANMHDFIYINDNHYILMGYCPTVSKIIPQHIGEEFKVLSSVVQEVKNGKVIFEWDSINNLDLYEDTVDYILYDIKGKKYTDVVHINSMVIDPEDDNLILSFRQNDEIIKIDRKTGRILWTLSGKSDEFRLSEQQKFSHQHTAFMYKNHFLTLFNNGNKQGQSSVITMQLDERNKKILKYSSSNIYPKVFTQFLGSFQIYNGRYIVDWGARLTAPEMPDITEYNPVTGEVNFELFLPGDLWSYRAYKVQP